MEGRLTTTLEPTDKLGAMPRPDDLDEGAMNGPEGGLLDWPQINWDAAEGQVGVCDSGSSRRRRWVT